MKTYKILLIVMLVFLIGCEETEEVDTAALIADGWDFFINNEFDSARGKFTEALNNDGDPALCNCGLGWCELYLEDYDESKNAFEISITADSDYADSHAGLTFAARALNEFDIVIEASSNSLQYGGDNYEFQYLPSVNWWDIRYSLAQAYFHTTDYLLCYEQLEILDPYLVLDPESEFFVEDLLEALESIVEP